MNNHCQNESIIKDLDYKSLVTLLTKKITPTTRKIILERLTCLNNKLLNHDYSRMTAYNSRKKDITENIHPSLHNKTMPNPIPINQPTNSNRKKNIDLDEIINNYYQEKNSLESELSIISNLQNKLSSVHKKN